MNDLNNVINLKDMLSHKKIIAPGVFDALSALLVEQTGFACAYLTGYCLSATRLGKPDLGLISALEIADTIAAISKVIKIPLIADADTGYGGPLNVMRTVELYEKAGAAAIQIEDQQWPKRCGHVAGKQVIPVEEMAAKIRAAVEARASSDTLIIARTDAIAVEGFDSAIKRADVYLRAGADILFVECPETLEQMAAIPSLLPAPHIINMAETGKGPRCTALEVFEMGYNIAIYPGTCLQMSTHAMLKGLKSLNENYSTEQLFGEMTNFREFNQFIGMYDSLAADKRYLEEALNLINEIKSKEV